MTAGNRRVHAFLWWMAGAVLFVGASPAAAGRALDPDVPEDALAISRKLACGSLTDGKPRYGTWEGQVYSRVQGEPDRLVFRVVGVNTRQCGTVTDAGRGAGFRSVSREVMLYLDPETREVLRTWTNPWTGANVEVLHVANDPVNMREPRFAYDKDGKPFRLEGRIVGDMFLTTNEFPLFYQNPLGGDYQENVGGAYQAIELFNNYVNAEDLFDADKTDAPRLYLSWTRVSQWLPWMDMGGRPGYLIIHTKGHSAMSAEELPDVLRAELEENYSIYLSPPPVDDTRSNETSWTYFKKTLDDRRATP